MAMRIPIYPEWDDIKEDVQQWELLEMIDNCFKNKTEISEEIEEYIKANYEPLRYEEDPDEAYEEMLERKSNRGEDNE